MQASAIRAAAANFRTCLEAIWPLAQRRNVPRAVFDQLLAGVTPDLRIMDLLDSQPEFTKAPWEYLDILVTDARIADGRAILAKHRAAVRRAWRKPTASTATSSRRSGASNRTTARRSAIAR